MLKLYLDNCCYCRPYDDRKIAKNYLEREAVLLIMQMAYDGMYRIIGSDVLEREMSMIADFEKRSAVKLLYESVIVGKVPLTASIVKNANAIMESSSLKAFDSLHLASALVAADILLTTDLKFLKAANRLGFDMKIINPLEFIMEVKTDGSNDSAYEEK